MTLALRTRARDEKADDERIRAGAERFPSLDGLRAVAALTVIGVHTAFASGFTTKHPGWGRYTSRLEIGVEVFFVLSGFLLYRPFAVEHFGGRPAPSRRTFWARRLKRIVPAYWLAFVVSTYVLKADSGGPGWKGPLVYSGFLQIYFPNYVTHGLSQAWTLCIEMSFYLMVPLYAAGLGRTPRTPERQLRAELTGLAVLTAVSFAYRIPVLSAHGSLARTMPDWLPAWLDLFSLGMVMAVVSAYLAAPGRSGTPAGWQRVLWHRSAPWASWLLAAACFWAVSNIGLPLVPLVTSPLGLSLERQTLYGLFAFFLVLPAVFGPQDRGTEGTIRRLLSWKPMALVGVVSYGVYLWHEAWMHMFFVWTGDHLFDIPWLEMLAAVTALAVAAAAVSYRVLERPIVRYRRGTADGATSATGPRWPSPAAVVTARGRLRNLIGTER